MDGSPEKNFTILMMKGAFYQLTKICGYGVPDDERAMSCAANSLSLISEGNDSALCSKHETQSRYVLSYTAHLPAPLACRICLGDRGEIPCRDACYRACAFVDR